VHPGIARKRFLALNEPLDTTAVLQIHMPKVSPETGFPQPAMNFLIPITCMRKLFVLLLALVAVFTILYAGLNGLIKNYSYGLFFTFVGAITTIGLGLDVVNHLKIQIQKDSIRKLGGL
jgi:hypothetical protein